MCAEGRGRCGVFGWLVCGELREERDGGCWSTAGGEEEERKTSEGLGEAAAPGEVEEKLSFLGFALFVLPSHKNSKLPSFLVCVEGNYL